MGSSTPLYARPSKDVWLWSVHTGSTLGQQWQLEANTPSDA